ncbi:MAG: competence protein TfoX [Eubacteriales bacterium]|nr:competence protein TfoX [Eubacteriales bacterium]
MATNKEYLHFILDQLSDLAEIPYRCAFGEYMIYHCGKVAAYLCDNRLLVKPVPSAVRMMPLASYEPPYEGAKDMLLVDNVDDREFLAALFTAMQPELPEPKKKRK